MFFGTTPSVVAGYVNTELEKHKPKSVFVPFAGNFVVEQLAGKNNIEFIHSTDVSLYSKAIGLGVTNKPYDIVLKSEIALLFDFFADKQSPIEKAATVIFLTEVAANLNKKADYYKSLSLHAKENQKVYFEKILAKLNRFAITVKNMNFYGIDACRILDKVKENDFVFYDPPVGLGDYEKEFKAVESCYVFTPEPYTIITDTIKKEQLTQLEQRGANVYWRTNNPVDKDELPEGFKQVYQYRYAYNKHYCIYANNSKTTFVGSFQPLREKVSNYPLITMKDTITENSKVEIIKVSTLVTNHYRMMWVKKALMLDSGFGFVILVDNKLVGVLQLADGLKFGSDFILINSDPACPYSKYKRLSKLILHLCCTETLLQEFNNISSWEHCGFTTRVFTNEPVSMKYRGLFELAERTELVGENFKNKLIYQNKNKLAPDYKTALRNWLKKDGKILNGE